MKKSLALSALCFLAAASLLSCASDNPAKPNDPVQVRQIPTEFQAEANQVVAGNNAFAIDLYRNLSDEEGNLFFSPFSISTAFAMLHAGARTQTEAELAEVFHFPLSQARLHPLYRELLASIDRGAAFEGYRLNVANRLWGQQGFAFLPDYLAVTRRPAAGPSMSGWRARRSSASRT
jgi:serine protease inhibitor